VSQVLAARCSGVIIGRAGISSGWRSTASYCAMRGGLAVRRRIGATVYSPIRNTRFRERHRADNHPCRPEALVGTI